MNSARSNTDNKTKNSKNSKNSKKSKKSKKPIVVIESDNESDNESVKVAESDNESVKVAESDNESVKVAESDNEDNKVSDSDNEDNNKVSDSDNEEESVKGDTEDINNRLVESDTEDINNRLVESDTEDINNRLVESVSLIESDNEEMKVEEPTLILSAKNKKRFKLYEKERKALSKEHQQNLVNLLKQHQLEYDALIYTQYVDSVSTNTTKRVSNSTTKRVPSGFNGLFKLNSVILDLAATYNLLDIDDKTPLTEDTVIVGTKITSRVWKLMTVYNIPNKLYISNKDIDTADANKLVNTLLDLFNIDDRENYDFNIKYFNIYTLIKHNLIKQ
jgi:hypothetical protein